MNNFAGNIAAAFVGVGLGMLIAIALGVSSIDAAHAAGRGFLIFCGILMVWKGVKEKN